jgi:cytochrome c biogenesis protein CcmG/thiol:disulfide interchange protein DsbE
VIVNKWGSWCTPCRAEFPVFQQVAARYGSRIAFLGDDVHEASEHAGAAWLARFPVTYPSYADRSNAVNDALNPAVASYTPVTYFYDTAGRQVFFHDGPYLSLASLEHDIRVYLGA